MSFYVSELLRAGDHAEVGSVVKATGAALFRRFYVTNSIMTYPPQDMLIVALFFACKAEGIFPRIGDFISKFGKTNPEEILAGEYLLSGGIRYAYEVKHPFRALGGATMELRKLGDIDENRIRAAEKRAYDILCFSPLITDAYFHYTPSQIMFAALSLADRGLAERLMSRTFHYVTPPPSSGPGTPMATGDTTVARAREIKVEDKEAVIGSHIRDKVLGTIEACRDMLSKELPERREHWSNKAVYKAQIQPIRKKLAKCRDPDRYNLVELQRTRREQAGNHSDSDDEDDTHAKSLEKDAAVFGDALLPDSKRRKVIKTEDPFGPPL